MISQISYLQEKTMTIRKTLLTLCFLNISTCAFAEQDKIGSSLHAKEDISIDSIPQGALHAVEALAPKLNINEAEKELKNGEIYIDIEGTLDTGEEIEFDLLKNGEEWKVVEIQRDLKVEQLPKSVYAVLQNNTKEFEVKRIIESIQHGKDIIIYEFYGHNTNDEEIRKEVKLENGKAELLTAEWAH